MRLMLIIGVILVGGLVLLFRAADNQLAPPKSPPAAATPASPIPAKEAEICFSQGFKTLRSAAAFELEAPRWKWYGDSQEFMGSTGYVPIAGDTFEASITYQIVGPSAECVNHAVLYATVSAPAARAATKRKFEATMKRWFINTNVNLPAPLEAAVAGDKTFAGTSGDVLFSYEFERFPNPTIQPDGSKYNGRQFKIEFRPAPAAKVKKAG